MSDNESEDVKEDKSFARLALGLLLAIVMLLLWSWFCSMLGWDHNIWAIGILMAVGASSVIGLFLLRK